MKLRNILLLTLATILVIASCSKKINNPVYVKKEAYTQKIIYNTEATAAEWNKALEERFKGKDIPSEYKMDFTALKGKKGLRVRIKVGSAPLVDTCCTFGAVGSVVNDTTIHQEYTQIKTLQEGEYFEWIDIIEFPPNGLPPVIIAMAYVHGGNWLTDPIVFDYVPDLGVGQYTLRITGDVLPTYRPIGSNDIVAQVN